MKKVLKLAKMGEGFTGPNPMVGSLIVKDEKVVGKGYHKYYGGPHAEIYALREAEHNAKDATLYVNLEPCSHYGKTPPCALKIIKSGVKKVVIGMRDPNPKVAGKGINLLKKAGIKVKVGVSEKEAKELNKIFIKYITTELPYVYLKTAQTLDGYIATSTGDSKWITNKKARLSGHRLRHKVDAILVGIGTVLSDNPALTTRLPQQDGKDSIRVILDSNLRIPLDAKIINQKSTAPTIVVSGNDVDSKKIEMLNNKEQVEVLELYVNDNGQIPIKKLLRILYKREISSILVEGGSKVKSSFLKENLVDSIYTFIAPKIMGGSDGIPSFFGKGPAKMMDIKELNNVKYEILDDNILVTGDLNK